MSNPSNLHIKACFIRETQYKHPVLHVVLLTSVGQLSYIEFQWSFFPYLVNMDFFLQTESRTSDYCWYIDCGLAYLPAFPCASSPCTSDKERSKHCWNHGIYYREVNLAPCEPTAATKHGTHTHLITDIAFSEYCSLNKEHFFAPSPSHRNPENFWLGGMPEGL